MLVIGLRDAESPKEMAAATTELRGDPNCDDPSPDPSPDHSFNFDFSFWDSSESLNNSEAMLSLSGVQVDKNKYTSIQRNATKVKGKSERLLPKPIVVR